MSRSLPALFVRGGTSNGLVIQRRHLPAEDEWRHILPSAMGSPDPYGRQLNGLGMSYVQISPLETHKSELNVSGPLARHSITTISFLDEHIY
jgi:hypothetical protein